MTGSPGGLVPTVNGTQVEHGGSVVSKSTNLGSGAVALAVLTVESGARLSFTAT